MPNDLTGSVWILDTVAGVVTRTPVNIRGILVTWKVASAGAIVLSEVAEAGDGGAGKTILDAVSSGATSAATNQLSQWFPIEGVFSGLHKTTMTEIAKIAVYVK